MIDGLWVQNASATELPKFYVTEIKLQSATQRVSSSTKSFMNARTSTSSATSAFVCRHCPDG